jgi:uncharacterized damage-inducible protein DinB
MNESEKLEILGKLQAGRDALSDALAAVDEASATRKPALGGWSILDCVEHVVVTEQYLLTRLEASTLAEEPFEKWRREAKIAGLASDRTRRIDAPQQAHPHGRYQTLSEALAAFDATRAEVVRWVQNCDVDLRCMMTSHMLIEGPVTCAETLIMIAAHPARHAKQIEEIRAHVAKLSPGDRVSVAEDFFWACGATGTISAPPEAVVAISGSWDEDLTRQEKSALGTNTVYWVWFDEPQFDADGDGPYKGGQIWASALTRLTPKVH